jgi:hypothetical protein
MDDAAVTLELNASWGHTVQVHGRSRDSRDTGRLRRPRHEDVDAMSVDPPARRIGSNDRGSGGAPVRPRTCGSRVGLCLLSSVLGWLAALGCAAPITCPPHHFAREETMCPPCVEGGHCPCTLGWVCREDPEVYDERLRRFRAEALAHPPPPPPPPDRVIVLDSVGASSSPPLPPPAPPPLRPHAAPEGVPEVCGEPCPGNAARRVRVQCIEDERVRDEFALTCPESRRHEATCAVPWHIASACDPPPRAPRPRPVCRAKPGTCCLEDGTVVVPCGPGPARQGCHGGACGSQGGFCSGCR